MTITPPWRLPAVRLLILMLGALGIVNVLLMPVLNVSVDVSSASLQAKALALFFIFSVLPYLIYSRIEASPTPIGRALEFVIYGIGNWTAFACALILIGMAQATFSYLMIATAMPLQDAALSSIDHALGFDWLAFLEWTNDRPDIAQVLAWAYTSSKAQILLVAAVLAFTCASKMWDFLAVLMVCLTITLAISGLMPALAPYAVYQPAPEIYRVYSELGTTPGISFLAHYEALRSGSGFVLVFGKTEGLVTFPSYHTVVALLIPYALRHLPILFWPALAVNALVVISTLPVGGHYLVDLFGGVAVAVAGVYVLRQWKLYVWPDMVSHVPVFSVRQPVQS